MDVNVSYKLKRSWRAKRLRLAVYCDGTVVITTPFGVDQSIVEKFFLDKKRWIQNKLQFFKNIDSRSIRSFSRKDYLENKEQALILVKERVEWYNALYGFSFNKVFIKNQKTRWGSCSNKKNLNFNYKIIFLPPKHRDYIIVHELCHLKEFNHSKRFWALVEKVFPDYRDIKNELRNQELFYK